MISHLAVSWLMVAFSVAVIAQAPAQSEKNSSVSGRVLLDGEPLQGIVVALERVDRRDADRALPKAATNSKGEFRIGNVQPGHYVLRPISSPYVVAQGDPTAPGLSVVLSEREEKTGVELAVAKGGVITGTVRTMGGWPVAGITIKPVWIEGRYSREIYPRGYADQTRTDDRGVYRIFGLPPDTYRIRAERSVSGSSDVFAPGVEGEAQARAFQILAGGEVTDADIVIPRPELKYSIRGTVADAAAGVVLKGEQLSLKRLLPGRNPEHWSPIASTASTEDGTFGFDDLPPGKYSVEIDDSRGNGEYFSDPVTVELTDADLSGVEVRAHPGGSITGNVVFTDPANVRYLSELSSARLILWTEVKEGWTGHDMHLQRDGSFRVTGLKPARYRISFPSLPILGGRIFYLSVSSSEGPLDDWFTLSSGQQVTGVRIQLSTGSAEITGRVLVEDGAVPPGWQPVLYVSKEGSPAEITLLVSPDGTFNILGLLAGTYHLGIGMQSSIGASSFGGNYSATSRTITIADGQRAEVNLAVRRSRPR